MGQDDFSYTVSVEKNDPKKESKAMTALVLAAVAGMVIFWWRKAG